MLQFIAKYWIEVGFGLMIGFITFIYRKIGHYYIVMNSTKNGVKVLLKGEIIRRCNLYRQTGSITIFDKEIIMDLYQEYKNLGGNGLVEDMIKEISKIPMMKDHGG